MHFTDRGFRLRRYAAFKASLSHGFKLLREPRYRLCRYAPAIRLPASPVRRISARYAAHASYAALHDYISFTQSRLMQLRWLIHLFILILFFSIHALNTAYAKDYELSSEHFYATFRDDEAQIAKQIILRSEQIYARLSKILKTEIDDPIYIIIQPQSERNDIDWGQYEAFFVYLDENTSAESIDRQIAHGLTILLTLQTSDHSTISSILLAPLANNNEYAPDWYMLGLADYYATIDNPGALTQSPEFTAHLAQLLASDPVPTLGSLAAGKLGQPDPEANEIIGLALIQYFAQTYGPEKLTKWNHKYASDPIPFSYQKYAEKLTGKTWSEIYQDWLDETRKTIHNTNTKHADHRFVYYKAELDHAIEYHKQNTIDSKDENHDQHDDSATNNIYSDDIEQADSLADTSPNIHISETDSTQTNENDNAERENDNPDSAQPQNLKVTRYQAWRTAWPDEYLPYVGVAIEKGLVIGLDLFGEDLLNHHIYDGHVYYMSEKNHVDVEFHYTWKQFAWSLDSTVALSQRTVSWDKGDDTFFLDYMTHFADLGTERFWYWGDQMSLKLRIAYYFEYNNPLSESAWNAHLASDDHVWLPQLGWTGHIYSGIDFQYATDPARTMLDKAGYDIHASVHIEAPFLGAQYYTFITDLQLTGAWVMPYFDRHAIIADIYAGFSNSNNPERFPFEILSDSSISLNEDILLHGYPQGMYFGKMFALLNLKYSASIAEFQAGLEDFPLGINRIGMAIFGDGALILAPDKQHWAMHKTELLEKFAAGLEISVDLMFSWHMPIRFTYGFAYGMSKGGNMQHYIYITL